MEGKDLRKAGLKVTLPRLKILDILEGSVTRHMSAEDIYKSLIDSREDIGLATVYRVLTQFEAAGLVTRHHFEDGMAVFELNQGAHHDHIVCLDCGRVEEFVDGGIEERQNAVAIASASRSATTRWSCTGIAARSTARASASRTATDRARPADARGPRRRASAPRRSAASALRPGRGAASRRRGRAAQHL